MTRKRHSLWLTSALLLSSLAVLGTKKVDASVNDVLVPDYLDTPKSQIQGKAPALRITTAHPYYNYYKTLTGGNRAPRLFKGTYHKVDFYTPVAQGELRRRTNIYKPEQLYQNNTTVSKRDLKLWTNNSYVNTVDQLIDKNKSHHAKSVEVHPDVQGQKGYMRHKVRPSVTTINQGMFAGKKGEWRYLGYTEMNGFVLNPKFPVDTYGYDSYFRDPGRDWTNYEFLLRPWYKTQTLGYLRVNGGTSFDKAPVGSAEYKIKDRAVRRLLDERANYRRVSNNTDYWADRYSLQNDPSDGSAAYFIAAHPMGFYHSATVDALPSATRNMTLVTQRVVDANGKEIMKFTRNAGEVKGSTTKQSRKLVSGEEVTVHTTVQNTSPSGYGSTLTRNTQMQVAYKTGNSAKTIPHFYDANSYDKSYNLSANSKLAAGSSHTLQQKITVPFTSNVMAVYGNIAIDHYYREDNKTLEDDLSHLVLSVNNEAGNFVNQSIRLVDRSGNEVSHPVPGNEYKLRFYFKYDATTDSTQNVSININYRLNRFLPYRGKDSTTGNLKKSNFKPTKNSTYSVTTSDYIMFETGVFDVDSTLSLSSGHKNYNQKTDDDMANQKFHYNYDVLPRNPVLLPIVTSHTENGNMKYLMKFDVDYNVPSHVNNHAKEMAFTVIVDGKSRVVKEHIKQGFNPNVTVEIDVPSNGKSKTVNATVIANSDGYAYESNYANNSAKSKASVKNESKVRPYSGGTKTQNKWNQHTQVYKWNGTNKSYKHFNINQTFNFQAYTPDGSAQDRKLDLMENYQIKHVWFRSKTTQDLKAGPKKDGWVDLLKEPGKIKAGYGYELKAEVGYTTDAFNKMPKPSSNQWVRPSVAQANLPNNIYIQTPDDKIHSVNGDGGTTKSLKYTRNDASNGSKTDWTFEVAPKKVLGVNTLGKFYIGEDVSNGTYDMTVFTPQTAGLLGKMTSETKVYESVLFDQKKNLKIEVIGSATDDLSSHITQ